MGNRLIENVVVYIAKRVISRRQRRTLIGRSVSPLFFHISCSFPAVRGMRLLNDSETDAAGRRGTEVSDDLSQAPYGTSFKGREREMQIASVSTPQRRKCLSQKGLLKSFGVPFWKGICR